MGTFRKLVCLAAIPVMLTACQELDYHGIDPKTYNEVLYPKKNMVEFNSIYQSFFFIPYQNQFDLKTKAAFKGFANRTYPSAVERLVIATSDVDESKQRYITRLLRAQGFRKSVMEYMVDPELGVDEVVVQLDYSYVITPDCPDWRKSSNLNYSNTNMSDIGCASVTNIGRQVANPKHLLESDQLYVAPDGMIGAQAITNYHTGAASVGASAASGSGDGGGESSAAAAP